MKKIIITALRTMLAVAAIIAFVQLGVHAYNWQSWCPNNDLGFALVVCMYSLSAIGICMGFYGISPIFWEGCMGLVLARICDDDEFIEDARRGIHRLRKTWVW